MYLNFTYKIAKSQFLSYGKDINMEQNFEKKHSIERVVGVDKEEKEGVKEVVAEEFEKQNIGELRKLEVRKTPEQIEIINLVNKGTNELLVKYKLPKFDIPSKNVHLFSKEDYREKRQETGEGPGPGHFSPEYQAVFSEIKESKVAFAKHLYHEFVHFKSYQAAQRTLEGELDLYRVGLTVYSRDGKRRYFRGLNDAITEELVKRFYFEKIKINPIFKEEVDEIEKVREIWLAKAKTKEEKEDAMDIARLEPKEKESVKGVFTFSFQEQRQMFNNLLDKLYGHNKRDFKDREELFELFVKSMLSGNLLSVGKLVDRTFGKGVFRKIGELDNDIKKQKEFVKTL